MKLTSGEWNDPISFGLHIGSKNAIREMIESDPKAEGTHIDALDKMDFDERLSKFEPGDGGIVKNEEFMAALIKNYLDVMNHYEPGEKELKFVPKFCNFTLAIIRNDSAYYERIMGTIDEIINHINDYKVDDINEFHPDYLVNIYKWWKVNDKRRRTKLWIAWMFKYLIKKYKSDLFYRRSINMMFIFLRANKDNWQTDESYDPSHWFPARRGKFANAIFGGTF